MTTMWAGDWGARDEPTLEQDEAMEPVRAADAHRFGTICSFTLHETFGPFSTWYMYNTAFGISDDKYVQFQSHNQVFKWFLQEFNANQTEVFESSN